MLNIQSFERSLGAENLAQEKVPIESQMLEMHRLEETIQIIREDHWSEP